MAENIIKSVKIGPYPRSIMDLKMPEVEVKYEDGSKEVLFEFYPDEIDFKEKELIGLTKEEAKRLN
ncbi:MAG: hypothetical protein KGY75_09335 [Candidatus Cloacimonetes bacterium]|nr:hypothetical protein [Candidatus Cloacimonadota bacterium]